MKILSFCNNSVIIKILWKISSLILWNLWLKVNLMTHEIHSNFNSTIQDIWNEHSTPTVSKRFSKKKFEKCPVRNVSLLDLFHETMYILLKTSMVMLFPPCVWSKIYTYYPGCNFPYIMGWTYRTPASLKCPVRNAIYRFAIKSGAVHHQLFWEYSQGWGSLVGNQFD